MRPLPGVICAIALITALSHAELGADHLPSCFRSCIARPALRPECSSNQTCICDGDELNAEISECIGASCTGEELFAAKNASLTICDTPPRDDSAPIRVILLSFGIIAITSTILRIYARLSSGSTDLHMDDWMIILTAMLLIAFGAITYLASLEGLGKDIWMLPPRNISRILLISWFAEMLYFGIVSITKISILCFYLRVFPSAVFRRITHLIMAICLCWAVASILTTIFQCSPIDAAWKGWDSEYGGRCVNINAAAWASAAINLVLDLVTIALPLPQLLRLSLSTKKKLGVCMMFSVGIFVAIVSIIRLHAIIYFGKTDNPTRDRVGITNWTAIELSTGVLCACMPGVRQFLGHVRPCAFGSTHEPSTASSQRPDNLDHSTKHHPSEIRRDIGSGFIELVEAESFTSRIGVAR